MSSHHAISEHTINTGEQTVRYIAAGSEGIPIVFVHGWPQCADEFRHVMRHLSGKYRLFAMDLRGIGGTTTPSQDWTKETLAHDLHAFVQTLELERPIVIGHDIGGAVAYAHGRLFSENLRGIGVLDLPLPGLAPWDDVVMSAMAWHFDFHGQKPLAEDLVSGRQKTYLRYFYDQVAFRPEAISDEDVDLYAAAYETRDQLTAGFELYRAFPIDAEFGRKHTAKFELPMLLAGGSHACGQMREDISGALKQNGVTNLTSVVIEDSGHWVCDEQPEATATVIDSFAEKLL